MQEYLLPWLITFGGLWMVVWLASDTAQRFLYDEIVPWLGLRSLALVVPLSALMVWLPPDLQNIDSMMLRGLFHVVVWFPGVWLVLRYQWHHALVVSVLVVFLAGPILVLAIESMTGSA